MTAHDACSHLWDEVRADHAAFGRVDEYLREMFPIIREGGIFSPRQLADGVAPSLIPEVLLALGWREEILEKLDWNMPLSPSAHVFECGELTFNVLSREWTHAGKRGTGVASALACLTGKGPLEMADLVLASIGAAYLTGRLGAHQSLDAIGEAA